MSSYDGGPSSPTSYSMRGWLYTGYGDPREVLEFETELGIPTIAEDQVLIKVVAAALNPIDAKRMRGFLASGNRDSPLPVFRSLTLSIHLMIIERYSSTA